MPPGVVEDIRARCSPDGIIRDAPPKPFKANDMVRVTEGPFAEWTGIFARSDKERVWLLMQVMGRSQTLAFAPNVLEAA